MKRWAEEKGFTIVEMLVVIVVIGILVGISVISYNGIQQRSRDSERGSDVTQIKIALEKYYADKSRYPLNCAGSPCAVSALSNELTNYMKTIPHDPKHAADSAADYQYVATVAGDGYAIRVQYEAKAVCKTGQNVYAPWWGAATPTC